MVGPHRIAVALLLALVCSAQKAETYKVRITPVAMDAAMKVNIAGSGSATAALAGNKLTLKGSFEGLLSPATKAQLHRGSATGVRGRVIFELTIDHAPAGAVTGSFDLNADQIESLRKGRFYLEIASEKAPDGNLWGWLLP
ncbi:MAG TPA: CHRD domain-containing protein [Bryobacteraceae bacterium]|nr:CHRD domain-containing protein [Bryobacteraceae bacterium]